MSGSHALFAPSSAHRIATCPGSLLATKDLPDAPGFEAVEGTVAHYLHELALRDGTNPASFVGMRPSAFMPADELTPAEWGLLGDFVVPPEMPVHVMESVDRCRQIEGVHFVEERVCIDQYTPIPDQFGTSDHFCVDPDNTLFVDDLKYGKGVKVFARRNPQLVLYALGVIERYDWLHGFSKVVLRILQPRLDHFDVWETTADELRAIGAWLRERFRLAMEPDAPFQPETHACQFCKLRPVCPALFEATRLLVAGHFDDLDNGIQPQPDADWPISTPNPATLTHAQIATVIAHKSLIEGFLGAVETRAMHLLLHDGDAVPGLKLVEGRTNRSWRSREHAIAFLESVFLDPFEHDLLSPAKAEKALPKPLRAELAALIHKPPGAPTLAPADDPRPAFSPHADLAFPDLTLPQASPP